MQHKKAEQDKHQDNERLKLDKLHKKKTKVRAALHADDQLNK